MRDGKGKEESTSKPSAYRDAGVDIDAQDKALGKIKGLLQSTYTPGVLSDLGAFGGLFRPELAGLTEPVLVASADGVGTKLAVARLAGDFSTIGRDLVNHCVNDILVQGAIPLFFLDYVGAGVLEPDTFVDLVRGVVAGCKENNCALLGGETAEMPGFYQPGDYELVGFIVGLADRCALLDGSRIRAGDLILGLPSSGLHTNGYSLARRIFFDRTGLGLEDAVPGLDDDTTLGTALLAPHRSYLQALQPFLQLEAVRGLAHITGGGLTDNLPRILPPGTGVRIWRQSWAVPPLFQALQEHGEISDEEMFRVFNMGIGMVMIVAAAAAEGVLETLQEGRENALVLGVVEEGDPEVVYDLGVMPPRAELGGEA